MTAIKWKDDRDIYGRMLTLTNSPIFKGLRDAVDHYNVDLSDCLSWGQLKSKRWLVEEVEKLDINLGTVFLCAGWYSIIANMLLTSTCSINVIRSFDIDEKCQDIAETINRNFVVQDWKFKASTFNILDMNYPLEYITYKRDKSEVLMNEYPDTIINTSCEHIDNFSMWYDKIPTDKLVILQTNNYYDIEDHINCSESLDDFANITPMKKVLYEGELDCNKYTRYMRIGYK